MTTIIITHLKSMVTDGGGTAARPCPNDVRTDWPAASVRLSEVRNYRLSANTAPLQRARLRIVVVRRRSFRSVVDGSVSAAAIAVAAVVSCCCCCCYDRRRRCLHEREPADGTRCSGPGRRLQHGHRLSRFVWYHYHFVHR